MCSLIHTRSLVALTLSVAAARSCSALPALQPRDPASVMRQQEENERERRNAILIVHAVCGFLAFQIFAPLGELSIRPLHLRRACPSLTFDPHSWTSIAVVVASVGRSWGDVWFKLHYRVQLFVVFPLAASPSRISPFGARELTSTSLGVHGGTRRECGDLRRRWEPDGQAQGELSRSFGTV